MIAYGAGCTWWDDKSRVASLDGTRTGLPCCPHCRGVLFEIDEDQWDAKVLARDLEVPGYLGAVTWLRGRCYRTFAEAEQAYLLGSETT